MTVCIRLSGILGSLPCYKYRAYRLLALLVMACPRYHTHTYTYWFHHHTYVYDGEMVKAFGRYLSVVHTFLNRLDQPWWLRKAAVPQRPAFLFVLVAVGWWLRCCTWTARTLGIHCLGPIPHSLWHHLLRPRVAALHAESAWQRASGELWCADNVCCW